MLVGFRLYMATKIGFSSRRMRRGVGPLSGAHPTLSVTEFYVTPFDRLIWNSPEESVVSTLSRGTLIGFILSIADFDEEGAWHCRKAGHAISGPGPVVR